MGLAVFRTGAIDRAMAFYDEAVAIHEQIPEGDPFRNWALGISYGLAGRDDQAQSVIDAMTVHMPATAARLRHIAYTEG